MKIFKKVLVSLVIMTALFSTSVFANSKGDEKVRTAAELTIAKTQEAYDVLSKGGSKEDVLKLLGEVRQSQKEFRYEQTERLRQKAGDALRAAHTALEKGEGDALPSLKLALDFYNQMFVIYKAAH